MRKRIQISALLLCVALGVYACTTIATGPTTATGGNSTQSQGGGNGASPSPGTGGDLPAGSFVRIGLFGQSCPSGTTPPPNGTRQILPNCTGFITATPKDSTGNDLPAAVHGPTCAWSVTAGQSVVNLTAPSEPFNRDARCLGVGPFALQAQVKNVTGSADFSCEAAAGAHSALVRERIYFWDEELLWLSAMHNGMAPEDLRAAVIERDQARYR